jgi:hypothetical protein
MTTLEHRASARTGKTAAILSVIWVAIMLLWLLLDLSNVIAFILLATTVPAAFDFANNRQASLRLDENSIDWTSGRASGTVALKQIEQVRFETRLDLSVRVRLVLRGGKRLSLPHDSLPPWEALQKAFEDRGIATQRHHFSLM